jgi:hypothetical protein
VTGSGCCQDHDPILHATYVTCGHCGARSWPTDAEWITGTLVLATYAPEHEPGCPWRGFPATVLLDLGQDDQAIPAVQRPRLCRATASSTGRQCRGHARPGSGYCSHHDPAHSRGEQP